MTRLIPTAVFAAAALTATAPAFAADPAQCRDFVIADGGWTDNIAQNGFAEVVFEGLGYRPDVENLAIGVMLEGMVSGDVDVFLGMWSMNEAVNQPYIDSGDLMYAGKNLEGAVYTLAVPTYAYEAGLQSFQDIADWEDELDGRIYGLEPGNDSNLLLIEMQEQNALGFENFSIMASSEQAMLQQVERAVDREEPIVFVGWAPHPMNTRFDMTYLEGGDDWFGPDYGASYINTGVRPAFAETCPNALKVLEQLYFEPDLLGASMDLILNEELTGVEAATQLLRENPELLDGWLSGVTTFDGAQDGAEAVKETL